MPTKCHVHNCTKPSVSKGLCDTHRKRVARHGSTEQTRPVDWGAKEKHPKYQAWCNLRRYHHDAIPAAWAADFWAFVADTPSKPDGRVTIQRANTGRPWGPDNFYWKEPIVDADKRADRAAYMREYSRKMRAVNPDYSKNAFLKRRYGIGIDRYNEMLAEQNGSCAICGKAEGNEIRGKVVALAVDHCHDTGKIRALLCSNCNTALGLFNDDVALLAKARAYVVYHQQSGPSPARQTDPADVAQTGELLVHKDS
jgi:hypothetical protein